MTLSTILTHMMRKMGFEGRTQFTEDVEGEVFCSIRRRLDDSAPFRPWETLSSDERQRASEVRKTFLESIKDGAPPSESRTVEKLLEPHFENVLAPIAEHCGLVLADKKHTGLQTKNGDSAVDCFAMESTDYLKRTASTEQYWYGQCAGGVEYEKWCEKQGDRLKPFDLKNNNTGGQMMKYCDLMIEKCPFRKVSVCLAFNWEYVRVMERETSTGKFRDVTLKVDPNEGDAFDSAFYTILYAFKRMKSSGTLPSAIGDLVLKKNDRVFIDDFKGDPGVSSLGGGSTSRVVEIGNASETYCLKMVDCAKHQQAFEREVDILQRLRNLEHPLSSIPKLLWRGIDESFGLILTTPVGVVIEPETNSLRRVRFSNFKATAFAPLVRELGRIHAHGIIHRDIGPRNIIRKGDGFAETEPLVLIDWGFASNKITPHYYEGAMWFAADQDLLSLPPTNWDKAITPRPSSDLNSLMKTILYVVDPATRAALGNKIDVYRANRVRALRRHANSDNQGDPQKALLGIPDPIYVLQAWGEIWKLPTPAAFAEFFKKRVEDYKTSEKLPDEVYSDLAKLLETL